LRGVVINGTIRIGTILRINMNLKEQVDQIGKSTDWKAGVLNMSEYSDTSSTNVESYVKIIYMIHHILVEGKYSDHEGKKMEMLLQRYFNDGNAKFINNSEYLFFIGKIL